MSATTGTPPRTAAANAARHHRTQASLQRVSDAITRMRRDKTPISVAALARRANVSRTFLYTNPHAQAQIHAAASKTLAQHAGDLVAQDDARESTWRERALNAEQALNTARGEILSQRGRIAELLGQLRDLEAEWSQDAIQRITTENTTLKQRLRQLTQDNRVLNERLAATRSTLRFQDRRMADLEAQLVDTTLDETLKPRPPHIPTHHARPATMDTATSHPRVHAGTSSRTCKLRKDAGQSADAAPSGR